MSARAPGRGTLNRRHKVQAVPALEASAAALPSDFFESAWSRFEQVGGGIWRVAHQIGGSTVAITGKGEHLAQALLPALEHLRASAPGPARQADLEIRTWDRAWGGQGLPALPASSGDALAHDRIMHVSDERFVVVWERHFAAVTLVDRTGGRAIYFTEDAAVLPYYETAAPLRALWHAWFSARGKLPLHGACVGRDGDALLLTAPGGNGKSTTALLALQAGFDYLADDWCLLSPREPAAYSLFNTAKLRPNNLHRFPGLESRIHNWDKLDEEKATFFLQAHFPNQLRGRSRLRAIVIPRVSGETNSTFQRENSALAWHALMGVTLRGIAGSGREVFSLLGEVARCVPVYRLNLGSDLSTPPIALDSILQHVRGL
jgi:hypothetical protein